MTAKQKFEAEEKKRKILSSFGYRCVECGAPAISLAHRIPKTKANLKKYGDKIINHELNLAPVCSNPKCNDMQLIGNKPMAVKWLVREIQGAVAWWEQS